MLHSLANQYGVEWNKRVFSELIGTWEAACFAIRHEIGHWQPIKLDSGLWPNGRRGCRSGHEFRHQLWFRPSGLFLLHHKNKGEEVSEQEMQKSQKESPKKVRRRRAMKKIRNLFRLLAVLSSGRVGGIALISAIFPSLIMMGFGVFWRLNTAICWNVDCHCREYLGVHSFFIHFYRSRKPTYSDTSANPASEGETESSPKSADTDDALVKDAMVKSAWWMVSSELSFGTIRNTMYANN